MPGQNYSSFTYPQSLPQPPLLADAPMEARREMMVEQAGKYGLESMLLGNQQSKANLDRYTQETPHYITQQEWKAAQDRGRMNRRGFLESQLSGEMGTHQQQAAKGRIDQATAGSTIDKTNASNFIEAFTANLQRIHAIGSVNPMAAEPLFREWKQSLPEGAQEQLPPFYTTQWGEQALQSLSRTPASRGTLENTQLQGTLREKTAVGNRESAERIAGINAKARVDSAYARQPAAIRAKLDNVLATLVDKMSKGPLSPDEWQTLNWIGQLKVAVGSAGQAAAIDPNLLVSLILKERGITAGPRGPASAPPPPGDPRHQQEPVGKAVTQADVEAKGEKYDPATYDYEWQNGQLMKRRK